MVLAIHADTCMKSLENLEPIAAPSAIDVKVGARDDGDLGGGALGTLTGLIDGLTGGL